MSISRSRFSARPSIATRRPTSSARRSTARSSIPSRFPSSMTKTASCSSTPFCSTPGGSACCSRCRAPISWSTWKSPRATCSSCVPSCPTSLVPSFTSCSALASRAKPCSSAISSTTCAIRKTNSSWPPAFAVWSCWCSRCRPTLMSSRSSRMSSALRRTWTGPRSKENS